MYSLLIKQVKDDKLKDIYFICFDSFDNAYKHMRSKLKEYGLSKECIFDGKGNIKEMYKYFNNEVKELSDCKGEDWYKKLVSHTNESLKLIRSIILNEEVKISSFNCTESMMIKYSYKNGIFNLSSWNEGPSNGIVPSIQTNLLKLNQNHYYLYVKDDFGGNDRDSYSVNDLYLYLIECNVE